MIRYYCSQLWPTSQEISVEVNCAKLNSLPIDELGNWCLRFALNDPPKPAKAKQMQMRGTLFSPCNHPASESPPAGDVHQGEKLLTRPHWLEVNFVQIIYLATLKYPKLN